MKMDLRLLGGNLEKAQEKVWNPDACVEAVSLDSLSGISTVCFYSNLDIGRLGIVYFDFCSRQV